MAFLILLYPSPINDCTQKYSQKLKNNQIGSPPSDIASFLIGSAIHQIFITYVNLIPIWVNVTEYYLLLLTTYLPAPIIFAKVYVFIQYYKGLAYFQKNKILHNCYWGHCPNVGFGFHLFLHSL